MTTLARTNSEKASHWYDPKTEMPCHEVENKSKGGMRPTTLRDARKLGLVPSVTNVLRTLAKPELEAWKQEMVCLAVLTTPRLPYEADDAFVFRVLHDEKIQDEEMNIAREKGIEIHDALDRKLTGQPINPDLESWVLPVVDHLNKLGKVAATEKILVGKGYAGKTDAILSNDVWWILDFKTTKSKLPTRPWPDHLLQLGAYARAFLEKLPDNPAPTTVKCANIYISTVKPGEFVCLEHENWCKGFLAFMSLLSVWQFVNNYELP